MRSHKSLSYHLVNACTGRDGWIKIVLLDAQGRTIPGYAETDCVPITGDSTSHRVQWREVNQVMDLGGKPVRLRLRTRDARLYSIAIAEPGEESIYHRFSAARP